MSELKAIKSGEIFNIIEYEDCYRTEDLYYPKAETDKVIADKDKEIAELKKERDWLAKDRAQAYDDLEKLAQLNIQKDAEICRLKEKLRDHCIHCPVKEQEDDVVADLKADAGMRERKLKHALYKACANWAHIAVAFFSSYAIKDKWRKMESKCRAKAEEYK